VLALSQEPAPYRVQVSNWWMCTRAASTSCRKDSEGLASELVLLEPQAEVCDISLVCTRGEEWLWLLCR